MRTLIAAACAVMLVTGAASAKTYQLTYVGKKLTRADDRNALRGAKRLILVLESATPYRKSTCFNLPLTDLASLTDGVDTLASLAASGYILSAPTSSISLCTDDRGKQIVSWQIVFEFSAPPQGGAEGAEYYLVSYSTPLEHGGYSDEVDFRTQHKKNGRINQHADYNVVTAGTWRYKVLD
jgi:hypothetical protein